MTLQAIDIRIELVSPFMTGGEINPLFGVDARLPRKDGRPVIPGTLVRGVLRDALLAICRRCGGAIPGLPGSGNAFIGDVFGRASGLGQDDDPSQGADDRGASNAPQRGAVTFEDFEAEPVAAGSGTITRIRIDEALGSAEEGHLQVLDLPFPIGATVAFCGRALVRTSGALPVASVVSAFELALGVVPAIGAHKSAGFGRVAGFAVTLAPAASLPAAIAVPAAVPAAAAAEAITFALDFDGPFLVGAERIAPNVFAGAVEVSGGAIKGAVANVLGPDGQLPGDLDAFLSDAVFRAARPAVTARNEVRAGSLVSAPECAPAPDGGSRPVVPPFSLCVYEKENPEPGKKLRFDLHDAILDEQPRIGTNPTSPPVLAVDWKSIHAKAIDKALVDDKALAKRSLVSMHLVESVVARCVRTRTAIDDRLGTARYEPGAGGALFVYDMVEPRLADGPALRWVFEIGAPGGVPADILGKLHGLRILIGKGPTSATLSTLGPASRPPVAATRRGAQWQAAVVLQTPALLTPIDRLRASGGDVGAAYHEHFRQVFAPVPVTLVVSA
ncbi:hypothetical protein A33M_1259 [Rhodovulum sp. PH10]|uniref:RAMP superfamily CRISPR-associated protein n=1 Tax=Rhodovulum sp. PH10 TaxID=1187851 RepID=UPI00027C2107|nr:RAMP superfamily CRISPR-associated protein [Rhodovulum sp. PH10]EJW09479.1 hypothetical protein A33M_1259 [Rhodovulum sp. PH10]